MDRLIKSLDNIDFVVCDHATKPEFLKLRNLHPRLKFKLYTENEIISLFLGQASKKSLFSLLKKGRFNYELAQIINHNLIFKNHQGVNVKTQQLCSIRSELIDEGVIRIDPFANLIFNNKKGLLLNALKDHSLLHYYLNKSGAKLHFCDFKPKNKLKLLTYRTEIDEIYAAFNNIAALLSKDVSPSNIKLIIPHKSYMPGVEFVASQYNIALQNTGNTLGSFQEIMAFIKAFKNIQFDNEYVAKLKDSNSPSLIKLYNLLCPFNFDEIDPKYHLSFIKGLIKETTLIESQNNGIEVITQLPNFSVHDVHYFYLGFVEGYAPLAPSSSPYLSDSEKVSLGMLSNEENAKIEEGLLISSLYSITNLYLSSAYVVQGAKQEPASIIKKVGIEVSEAQSPTIYYCVDHARFLNGVAQDDWRKYLLNSTELSLFKNLDSDNPKYLSYDYQFSGIEYVHPPLSLSFSSVDLYQKLPFDYFASYMLGLVDDSKSFQLNYGVFAHRLLEECKDDTSFEVLHGLYADQYNFSAKERFLVQNRKPILLEAFHLLKDYYDHVKISHIYKETKHNYVINPDLSFNGRIDKMLAFSKGDVKCLLVIDFKTGDITTSKNEYELGLNLQLPLYGLLLSVDERFKDYQIGGLVYSSMKMKDYKFAHPQFATKAHDSLRFAGIINGNPDTLALIEPNSGKSTFFRGLNVKNDGQMGGVVEEETLKEYIEIANRKIIETYEGIKNNYFPVVSKKYGSSNTSKYSRFKNISYIPAYGSEESEGGDE